MFNNMVPAHIAEQVGWNDGFDTFNPAVELSAGPLIIKSASSGRVVLVRNPKWWGPRSVLSRVTVTDVPSAEHLDPGTGCQQPDGGQSLGVQLEHPQRRQLAAQHRELGEALLRADGVGLQHEGLSDGPTAARQAIAHALDRPLLLNETFASMDPGLVINQDHLALPAQPDYTTSSASGEYGTRNLADTDAAAPERGLSQGSGRLLHR